MIIAITGYKQSGKDTIASHIVKKYGYTRSAFADPIREACKIFFGWDDSHFFGELKEVVDVRWGFSPRQFMQWLGTEAVQFHLGDAFPSFKDLVGRKFWVNRLIQHCKQNQLENVVVPDWRFYHEQTALIEAFSFNQLIFLRVERPSVTPNDPHPSEQDIPYMLVHSTIVNAGSIKELYEKVDMVLDAGWKFLKDY